MAASKQDMMTQSPIEEIETREQQPIRIEPRTISKASFFTILEQNKRLTSKNYINISI